MTLKNYLFDCALFFVVVLMVAAVVTYLWELIFHGSGQVDWATAFRLAIILGVVLPWVKARTRKQDRRESGESAA